MVTEVTGQSIGPVSLDCLTLEDGTEICPETSTLRKIPKERRSNLKISERKKYLFLIYSVYFAAHFVVPWSPPPGRPRIPPHTYAPAC